MDARYSACLPSMVVFRFARSDVLFTADEDDAVCRTGR